jgi:hypothetical protein
MNKYTFRSLTDQELQDLRENLPDNVKVRRSNKNSTKGKLIFSPIQPTWQIEEFINLIKFLDSKKIGLEREEPCVLVAEYPEFQSGIEGLIFYELTEISELQQSKYTPKSRGNSLGTLVSPKLKDAIAQALDMLGHQVGNIDRYVAKSLGYSTKELYHYFSAEQIDALALFLFNSSRGKGFILGDQTGVGKGRVVAGAIKYALKNGCIPIFVTDNPMLYADIMRDLWDIGIGAFNPLITNNNQTITLPNGEILESDPDLEQRLASKDLSGYDAIFTTYYQMQTIKGEWTDRHEFLRYFAKKAIICFDESHKAGVSVNPKTCSSRGSFARELADDAIGVLYASATFAKNPESLTFYTRTDLLPPGSDYAHFANLIQSGGVAIQQALASDLARSGQYIRRERSYEGIEFKTVIEDIDRQLYNDICSILAGILDFDIYYKQPILANLENKIKSEAKKIKLDGSIGDAGASSTNFVSIMHNLVDQMLLSMKAESAIAQAIEAVKNGEKPVITLANTMGSAIERYAKDIGLEPGDYINISFADVLLRYLVRSREVLISDFTGKTEKIFLSSLDLGDEGVELWEETRDKILQLDAKKLPVSPIDYITYKLREAGLKVGEITGRKDIVVYRDGNLIYQVRTTKERSKNASVKAVSDFNNGDLDCLIINRSGSTGISMHSSITVEDQRPRNMILLQAEKDINIFMQMLGRINRTGQINLPRYTLLIGNIPAEKRPAAVLIKKLASLNANTTGRRESPGVSVHHAIDFMNQYGDRVAIELMREYEHINAALAFPVKEDNQQNAIARVTGRAVFLPIGQQEWLYNALANKYHDFIENEEIAGNIDFKVTSVNGKLIGESVQAIAPSFPKETFRTPFIDGIQVQPIELTYMFKPHRKQDILNFLGAESPEQALELGVSNSEEIEQELRQRAFYFEDNYRIPGRERDESVETLIQSRKDQWGEQRNYINEIIDTYPTGQTVELSMKDSDSIFYGVVGEIIPPPNTANPSVPSAWKLKIYFNDYYRQIVVPFSAIAKDKKFILTPSTDISIWDAFDKEDIEIKQLREICYGNLLEICSRFKGKIVEFFDYKGVLRYGLLVPNTIKAVKSLEDEPVRIPDADTAIAYFKATNYRGKLYSSDRNLLVFVGEDYRNGDQYMKVEVPLSKKKGGQYYLNEEILKASGTEFESWGRRMSMVIREKSQIRSTLGVLTQIGIFAHIYKKEARELL